VTNNNNYDRAIAQRGKDREPLVHGLRNKTVAVDYTREVLLLQIIKVESYILVAGDAVSSLNSMQESG